MNKAKLKSYAPQARVDFIAAVTARANLLGLSEKAGQLEVAPVQTQGDVALIAGQAWPVKVAAQREQLIARMRREGFAQTCEAIAYTWFNRFAALRYMELHDYLGHGHRALSSAEGGLPDILTYASDLAHAGDTGLPGLKAELITEMKLTGNRDGELYRMLLVAQCNALSSAIPFLFERIDDDSELLLPDNLLRSDSVIAKLVEEIPEEDWAEVEIIGWLYQFYISDKKDQVIGKVVKSEDIPAATQLFTPNWIVQYLVQNSVGRLWLMANPQSALAKDWPYYITPAEQTPEVRGQLDALIQTRVREDGDTLNPESITVLDPACGSGHILVIAYDTLKAIYLERGYQPRVIPRLILEKNLYGLDIDDRAAQMAGFALMMKARADDRRLFNDPIKLNVLSLQESNGLDASMLARTLQAIVDGGDLKSDVGIIGDEFVAQDLFPESHLQSSLGESTPVSTKNKQLKSTITTLITTFADAKTFGSLITVPEGLSSKLLWLQGIFSLALQKGDLYAKSAAQDLMPLVTQAQVLSMQFDAIVANPPYMGSKGMTKVLKDFSISTFPRSKADLFSMFMERGAGLCKPTGMNSMVTMQNWMFLSSFESMRDNLLSCATISSLIQIGFNSFPEINSKVALASAFCFFANPLIGFKGRYINLNAAAPSADKNQIFLSRGDRLSYDIDQSYFRRIPGCPIAYWANPKVVKAFELSDSFEVIAEPRQGMATGDNSHFVRCWQEVDIKKTAMSCASKEQVWDSKTDVAWVPYNKGGGVRRWYGNNFSLLRFDQKSYLQLKTLGNHCPSEKYYFMEGITWGLISIQFSCRYMPTGFVFDVGGSSAFPKNQHIGLCLSLLNSKLMGYFVSIFNPTLNTQVGDLKRIPILKHHAAEPGNFSQLADEAIQIAKVDWDADELSWDFTCLPWISPPLIQAGLSRSWIQWKKNGDERFFRLKQIEEENNRLFINAYGLENELTPEVSEDQITLTRADREKDCQRLISYAIGCMMGRYSLNEPGLIYAHAGNVDFNLGRYPIFSADEDGIIPVTDELWFDEDASNRIREFVATVWGRETLEENIAWLAESLGAKLGETSDEAIRRYVADKFFKDHLQTYKKRPIYWLFSSGKQGAFQALIYLHRYNEGTLARMRAEYVVPLTSKIQSRIEMLEKDVNISSSTAARNKLTKEVEKLKKKHVELLAYDEQLRHYADMRITLDLDDGVKVNYGKFGDLLAEVKAVTGGASDE